MANTNSQGYQQLPKPPPAVYGPPRPYVVEKPPSLHIPSPESYEAPSLGLDQQQAYTPVHPTALTSPPILNGLPGLANQTQLGLPLVDENHPGHQAGIPADYYVAHPLKHDPEMSNGHAIFSDRSMPQDPSSLSFAPDLIDLTAPTLSHPVMTTMTTMTTMEMSHYSLMPAGRLNEMVSQNGWGQGTFGDPQPSFDIILPNQRGGKRGPFKDRAAREKTAHTRKIGSCIRCRMQRIRVSFLRLPIPRSTAGL